jgi:fatty-acyl-CoA synthase
VAVVYADRTLTVDDVVTHCWSRLASFKIPRRVVFSELPLPRMASGKVARRDLATRYGAPALAP